jgi:putative membrane-bound dehydrogenase-like protein
MKKITLKLHYTLPFFLLIGLATIILSYKNPVGDMKISTKDTLTEDQKRLPENALKGLTLAPGLEITPFAVEPMLKNPTNIDVDERGRVWVTEAYNYRPNINKNPTNPLGDRIVILEDLNGDGKADTSKVFYQGTDLNAPLGICVLGKKVIVSQSPYIWTFYDDNGDDKADRKEVMFSGIGGEQHDHGAHAFTFAADGKLYFNLGNEGKQLKDKDGNAVLDQDGDPIGPKKYKQGMVFRCDTDGSNVECLGNNFRNPYEVAVDSYGTMWQSDNDDDGNKGTRINYVMPYGNYGYTDEMTGAGWNANRTNIEELSPLKHWHLNDPGEVPNLLQTGAGSPTGMVIYEGKLLPEIFQGQMIHCDAGPNVVRSYPVQKNGAGYTAESINIIKGENDNWFRPADVSVAPDGSLIVADWYDPGVGGHGAGDQTKGRIYRVAPRGAAYAVSKENYGNATGAVHALQNPNLAVRYHAFNALQEMGNNAVAELEKCWKTNEDPRMRARAFWVLVKMKNTNPQAYIQQAISSENPDFKIMGIRAAQELNADLLSVVKSLVNDKDLQVRRECAVVLRHNTAPEAAELWATLAAQHDGKDRWYLEALGIGADKQWDRYFAAYLNTTKNPLLTEGSRDIIWRARTDMSLPYLSTLAADSKEPLKSRLRYFRAFDFNESDAKSTALINIIKQNTSNDVQLNKIALQSLNKKNIADNVELQKPLNEVLMAIYGSNDYVEFVNKFDAKKEDKNLLKLSLDSSNTTIGKNAMALLLQMGGNQLITATINGKDTAKQSAAVNVLSRVGSKESVEIMQAVLVSATASQKLKLQTAQTIGKSNLGEQTVLALLKEKKMDAALIPGLVASVQTSRKRSVREEALTYLPQTTTNKSIKKEPTISELTALKANTVKGQAVYMNNCASCHMVNNKGLDFGPALSGIGSKLPKEALLDAILHPSAAISFGYEGWEIKMKDGSTIAGIIVSKTDKEVEMRFPGGGKIKINRSNIVDMKEMKESMMTADLHQSLSNQQMADLIGYLTGLKG